MLESFGLLCAGDFPDLTGSTVEGFVDHDAGRALLVHSALFDGDLKATVIIGGGRVVDFELEPVFTDEECACGEFFEGVADGGLGDGTVDLDGVRACRVVVRLSVSGSNRWRVLPSIL